MCRRNILLADRLTRRAVPLIMLALLGGCADGSRTTPRPEPANAAVETVTLEIVSYDGLSCAELSDAEAAELAEFARIPADQATLLRAAGARIEQIRAAKVASGC